MAQDEFLEDDLDDQKTVEYIKNTLPQELKEKYTDDILYYMLDVINDYFTTSGVLDQEPDADGCIDIDRSPMRTDALTLTMMHLLHISSRRPRRTR